MNNKQNDMFLLIVTIVLALGGYFYLTGGQRLANATTVPVAKVQPREVPQATPPPPQVAEPHYTAPEPPPPPPPKPAKPPKKPVNPDDELPPDQIK